MGAGYGLVPSSQASPWVNDGRLTDLCPNEPVMVDLHWHHWELEPPLAQEISDMIVRVARSHLRPSTIQPHLSAEPQHSIANAGHLVDDVSVGDDKENRSHH